MGEMPGQQTHMLNLRVKKKVCGEPEYSDPWQETYYPFCGNGPLSANSTGDLVTITVSYYFEYFKPNVIFYPYYFTNTRINSKM